MVVPESAHPAFWKAAHYFGLELIRTPLDADLQIDVDAYRAAIDDSTVLLVASAPSLTLGMVDPIAELAPLALERDINFHVDSCVGGFFLPFAEKLGVSGPALRFPGPGRDHDLRRPAQVRLHGQGRVADHVARPRDLRHQIFKFGAPERPDDWYVTKSMTGTRPGGAIAAAWAVMTYLGEEGYLRVVGATMAYMRRWFDGIEAIDGLEVMGKPAMSVFGYTSRTLDMFAIADGLEARGWLVTLDTYPLNSIRFMQSAGHEPYVDAYLADLREVAELVRSGQLTADGGRATYT